MQSFVTGFYYFAQCLQASYMLQHATVLQSFSWLGNIPLYGCTTFQSFIHSLAYGHRLLPLFSYYEQCFYKQVKLFVQTCFHFFWLYIQEWNCWVIHIFMFDVLRNCPTVSKTAATFLFSPSKQRFQFSHIFTNTCYHLFI